MANRTSSNPVVLDTFTSDVVISTGRTRVRKIVLASAAAGDVLEFINNAGQPQLRMVQTLSPGWEETDLDGFTFDGGLIFDQSASTGLGAGDLVFIYL